jgi:hypothetical protein
MATTHPGPAVTVDCIFELLEHPLHQRSALVLR